MVTIMRTINSSPTRKQNRHAPMYYYNKCRIAHQPMSLGTLLFCKPVSFIIRNYFIHKSRTHMQHNYLLTYILNEKSKEIY